MFFEADTQNCSPVLRSAEQCFQTISDPLCAIVCHCLPLCATHPHYRALSLCTGTAASGAAPGVVTRCRGNRRQIKTSPVSDLLARALHFLTSFGPFLGFLAPISSSQRQQEDQKLTPADIRPRQSTKISLGHFQPLRADGPESLTFSND